MARDFTKKLNEAMTSITEKVNQVTSYHTTLSQTVTKLCYVVMRESGHDGLNHVIVPPKVNASSGANTVVMSSPGLIPIGTKPSDNLNSNPPGKRVEMP